MPMLNIKELHRTIDIKRQNRMKCYEIILEKIHKKIIYTTKREQSFCIYVIPEYIIGLPMINNNECTEYLIEKLNENGFYVKYTFPNLLYISLFRENEPMSKPNNTVNRQKLLTF